MIEPVRFVDGPPMLLAGIRREHTYEAAAVTMREQWDEFNAREPLPGEVGTGLYGVMCVNRERDFEYMSGVQVNSLEVLPAGTGKMRVPAARYAVFAHDGNVETVAESWSAIVSGWLPGSGFQPANSPDFERYDERFDKVTGDGGFEIWMPIE